ncbi:putative transposase Ptta/En/Spm plant [Arabidopsis thaliana x Arabidopsis arenosa]|uniref:Putative transposase Ptta/En/Spm plant n=1 Tax=Arabidopsis thaliana x Arabidopsis arenosa TaxID=1240361 RepID=A0A8T1Z184_9BRAS|nr:putative transposase Ptta/En/Spm plant [Arabidopsis thaliana x Arabidopsis arenosa]
MSGYSANDYNRFLSTQNVAAPSRRASNSQGNASRNRNPTSPQTPANQNQQADGLTPPPSNPNSPNPSHSATQLPTGRLTNLTLEELLESPGRASLKRLDPKRPPRTLWFDDDPTVAGTFRSIFERDFKEPHANWTHTPEPVQVYNWDRSINKRVRIEFETKLKDRMCNQISRWKGKWKRKGDEAKPKWIDPEVWAGLVRYWLDPQSEIRSISARNAIYHDPEGLDIHKHHSGQTSFKARAGKHLQVLSAVSLKEISKNLMPIGHTHRSLWSTVDMKLLLWKGKWKRTGDEAKPKWIDPEVWAGLVRYWLDPQSEIRSISARNARYHDPEGLSIHKDHSGQTSFKARAGNIKSEEIYKEESSRIEEEESQMCTWDNTESSASGGLSIHAKNKNYDEVAPRKKGRIYGVGFLQHEASSVHAEKIHSFDAYFEYLAQKDPMFEDMYRGGSEPENANATRTAEGNETGGVQTGSKTGADQIRTEAGTVYKFLESSLSLTPPSSPAVFTRPSFHAVFTLPSSQELFNEEDAQTISRARLITTIPRMQKITLAEILKRSDEAEMISQSC